MAAKLVVTKARGGSKITLVGTSGTELLTSKVFTEPRAKGATLRSLKGLLGEDIVIDDQTAAPAASPAPKPVPATPRRTAAKAVAADASRGTTARAATKARSQQANKPTRSRSSKAAR